MLTEQIQRRIISAISATVPSGPVLVIGLPPRIGRQLRELGYEVDGEPLLENPQAEHAPARHATVIIGIFDETITERRWAEALRHAAARSLSNVFFLAYVGHDAIARRGTYEHFAYQHNLRKHPGYYTVVPYTSLETERDFVLIPLQHVPEAAASAFPIDVLMEKRRLHMDMSRETGRRSDGHMDRYVRALSFIRPGDVVLDAACGMGYGAWLMASNSQAKQVIGLDIDDDAVAYARLTFADGLDGKLSYAQGDVQDLSRYPDNSIDFIASFETVEHIPDPDTFFAEAERVLRPGGRIMVSVPNRWVDETGQDPNPFHLHVYDWARLHGEMTRHFLPERAIGQTAGGGFRLSGHSRWSEEARFHADLQIDSEWCIAVCMKSPLVANVPDYQQNNYRPVEAPEWQLTRFAEQYENPWLMQALVQHGALRPWRLGSTADRVLLAEQTCARYAPGTADHAAGLAVWGHALLEDLDAPWEHGLAFVARIDGHLEACASDAPIAVRWKISLLYLKGLLLEAFGAPDAALDAFATCAAISPLGFSPAIATKTIMSHFRRGRAYAKRGANDEARAAWQSGVNVCRDVFEHGRWSAIAGDSEHPDAVGLFELMDVVALAQQCASALELLDAPSGPPVNFWSHVENNKDGWLRTRSQMIADLNEKIGHKDHLIRNAMFALSENR